jgi:hypothetical protein
MDVEYPHRLEIHSTRLNELAAEYPEIQYRHRFAEFFYNWALDFLQYDYEFRWAVKESLPGQVIFMSCEFECHRDALLFKLTWL